MEKHTRKFVLVSVNGINRYIQEQSQNKAKDKNSSFQKIQQDQLALKQKESVVSYDPRPKSVIEEVLEWLEPKKSTVKFPKEKARKLCNFVNSNIPLLKWNEHGEIIINDQIIYGSDLKSLINDAVKREKTSRPVGYKEFAAVLQNANIPESLLGETTGVYKTADTDAAYTQFTSTNQAQSFNPYQTGGTKVPVEKTILHSLTPKRRLIYNKCLAGGLCVDPKKYKNGISKKN